MKTGFLVVLVEDDGSNRLDTVPILVAMDRSTAESEAAKLCAEMQAIIEKYHLSLLACTCERTFDCELSVSDEAAEAQSRFRGKYGVGVHSWTRIDEVRIVPVNRKARS